MILDRPRVPYYALERRNAADRQAIKDALLAVSDDEAFILKGRVASFEQQLAAACGRKHAVAVSSGTAALLVALAALGAGPGDEVVVPAFGFHSTLTAVLRRGATPVLVDVDPVDWMLDVAAAEAALTPRTAGLVAVHMFSAMADVEAALALARDRGAWLLENAAVAIGMRRGALRAGGVGDASVMSFQPVKPVGGISDGGAVLTDADALAAACRMQRNHGQDGIHRFLHHVVGFNARMDDVNAVLLERRLARSERAQERRAMIAARYDEAFAALAPAIRIPSPERERTYYAYVLACEDRDGLERHLSERGVETVVYYPRPLHLQPAFAHLGYAEGAFPNAERACRESLALPLYPEMPDADVDAVIDAVVEHAGA